MQLDWNILRSGEQIIYRLRGLYERYGYSRFKMSKFEEYDLYVHNKDFLASDRMITFTDPRGVLMALKPDVTLSIVKNTREGEPGPRKVYYNESVYRADRSGDSFCEIMQTGVECIGTLDSYHVYEVISLAVRSLAEISPDYILNISHMGLVKGFLEAAGVPKESYPQVVQAVREKNVAGMRKVCTGLGLGDTVCGLLERLVTTYGSLETVLQEIAPLCLGGRRTREAWEQLQQICTLLKANGLAERVYLDFSVEGDMSYYNGIVFRGFIKGVSVGVLSGGRYDKMVARMGKNSSAIGFAICVDELERLCHVPAEWDADVLLLYDDATELAEMAGKTAELASAGKRVIARREPGVLRCRETVDMRGGAQA